MDNDQHDTAGDGVGKANSAGDTGGAGSAAGQPDTAAAGPSRPPAAAFPAQQGNLPAVGAPGTNDGVEQNALPDNLPDIKKVGRKNFAAVYIAATEEQKRKAAQAGATEEEKALGVGRVARLSDQEAIVLRAFLMTRDYEAAAKEGGKRPDGTYRLTADSVKRMLRRPNLRAVLDFAILKATSRESVDLDWLFSENRLVYEGDKVKTATQMQGMKNIVEMLKPRGGGSSVVVQQNNINSVYAGKPVNAVEAEWEQATKCAGDSDQE